MKPATRRASLILVAVSCVIACAAACSGRRDDRNGWVNYKGYVLLFGASGGGY